MKMEQVSDNCFAVLNEKNLVCDANSGFINLGGGVVIDTQSDLPHAQQMIDLLGKVWSSMPKRVINTHEDADHVWGNQLFEGAEIIGHRSLPERMKAVSEPKETQKLMWGAAHVITRLILKSTHPGVLAAAKQLSNDYDFEGIELVPDSDRRSAGSTEAWSVMFNLWQDVPLDPLNRGLSKLFGRLPRFVIDTLNRTSLRAGTGVGVTGLEYLFVDEEHVAGSETTNFSWQAGTSLGYAITKVVRFDLGYRYFDYGGDESPVFDRIDVQGLYELEQTSHEFRARMTVDVYSFRAPWRF